MVTESPSGAEQIAMICQRSLGGSTFRALLTVLAVVVTMIILGLMYLEREQVVRCTDAVAVPGQDPGASQPIISQIQPAPVHVVVQLPLENKTESRANPEAKKWDFDWDKKGWANPDEAQGVATRTLILVRHGQYDLNTGRLTELGWKQANLTGQRLRELNMPYQKIIHSTMDRAVETSRAIGAHLPNVPTQPDDVIQEGGPVPPDPPISYWSLPERTYFIEGPRLEAAFRKYFYRADKAQTQQSHEILVGHANIFRFLTLRALQFPPEAWMRVFIAHASITVLHLNPDGTVTMNKFGDCGHFPADMVTY